MEDSIKVLWIGDVSGRVGRETLARVLPGIRNEYKPDLVIANIENSAGGRGVTAQTLQECISAGVDIATGGDHTFDVKGFVDELTPDHPFVRPANYDATSVPGKGYELVDLGAKGKVAVIQLLGRELFSTAPKVRNPFWYIDELLSQPDIAAADVRLIEMHAEATSEKSSLAWYVKGRVHAVVGTHTHVATADNRILGGEIAYVSDIGQVGPYDACLWADYENAIHNFKFPDRRKLEVSENGPKVFNSVLIEIKNTSPLSIDRVDVIVG